MAYWDNPYYQPPNWYGGRNPTSGVPQDYYDTPQVRDDPDNQSAPYGEFERFLTREGFGGFSRRADWGRSQFNRARAGFDAAQLSNPGLTWRKYLRTIDDGVFGRAFAGLGPQQRGAFIPGQTRVIRSG